MKIATILKFNGQALKESIINAAGGSDAVVNYINNNEELVVSQTAKAMADGIRKETKNPVEVLASNKGFELSLMIIGTLGEEGEGSNKHMKDMLKMLHCMTVATEGGDDYEYMLLEKEAYTAL